MEATPLRASVSQEELSLYPSARAVFARRSSLLELSGTSFVEFSNAPVAMCRDLYGDLPFGFYKVPQATLLSVYGFIYASNGALLVEQNGGVLSQADLLQKLESSQQQKRDERPVEQLLSLVSTCTDCFWHWMMDSLPKVFMAETFGYSGAYLVPEDSVAPWSRASLEILGIEPARLISSAESDLRVGCLYVPTYFSGFNSHLNGAFTRMFRAWLLAHVGAKALVPSQRLFVARPASAKTRRILNQSEVEAVAKSFGFTTVCFEHLSLKEQIQLASNANAMLAPHGSGITHSLLMPEQSLLVEIFPFERAVSCDCYENLARVVGHRYVSIDTLLERGVDIEVDTNKLQEVLATELG